MRFVYWELTLSAPLSAFSGKVGAAFKFWIESWEPLQINSRAAAQKPTKFGLLCNRLQINDFTIFWDLDFGAFVTHARTGLNQSYGWAWLWIQPRGWWWICVNCKYGAKYLYALKSHPQMLWVWLNCIWLEIFHCANLIHCEQLTRIGRRRAQERLQGGINSGE